MKSVPKILKWCVCVFILFFAVELILRFKGFGPAYEQHLVVQPPDFFKSDSILGWKSGNGKFVLGKSNNGHFFEATIDDQGNRITSGNNLNEENNSKPTIQIFGCESTFGFSVSDSSTSCYKLQEMLPEFKIINKAVIGYGLAQMYLSLKESINAGDTPAIAVFNYASFDDERTPLNRFWSSLISYSISHSCAANGRKIITYPYFEYLNDSLQLRYYPLSKISNDWPLRDKLSLVNLLNSLAEIVADKKAYKINHSHLISEKIAFEIMNYCRLNHISPIFATITPDSSDILQKLNAKGFYTLSYGIEIDNGDDEPNKYNCGIADPQHPNGLAHTIYAQKLYRFLQDKKLIAMPKNI